MKKIISAFLIFILTLVCTTFVYAESEVIQITDSAGEHNIISEFNCLPGDNLQESVTIENATDKTVALYLKAEKEQKDLSDMMQITVTYNNAKVYEGSLQDIQKAIRLDILKKKENGLLQWEIHIPEELDNFYNMSHTCLNWVLYAEYETDVADTGDTNHAEVWMFMIILTGGYCMLYRKVRSR